MPDVQRNSEEYGYANPPTNVGTNKVGVQSLGSVIENGPATPGAKPFTDRNKTETDMATLNPAFIYTED
jgi:hypothetical protein